FGSEIPWHQDYSYWFSQSISPNFLNCMLYFDHADQENGCLQVIPGSHRFGFVHHQHADKSTSFEYLVDKIDQQKRVFLEAKAGDAIFFNGLLLHSSSKNNSAKQRRAATIVYTSSGNIPKLNLQNITSSNHDFYSQKLQSLESMKIKRIFGSGSHAGGYKSHYRRRALILFAISQTGNESWPWVEFFDNLYEEDTLELLSAKKPRLNKLFRFQLYNTSDSNRNDVVVMSGGFQASFERNDVQSNMKNGIGLAFINCASSGQMNHALELIKNYLKAGSILILEKVFLENGKSGTGAVSLFQFIEKNGIDIEFLGRADTQAVVKVTNAHSGSGNISYADVEWKSVSIGHVFCADDPELSRKSVFGNGILYFVYRGIRFLSRRILDYFNQYAVYPFHCVCGYIFQKIHFPIEKIPLITCKPVAGSSTTGLIARKELWSYALTFVKNVKLPWCEFGVGEGESLDWFSMKKPAENIMYGFDSFSGISKAWMGYPKGHWKTSAYCPNRDDVTIVEGEYKKSLGNKEFIRQLGNQIGFLHIDCDLYDSTKLIFDNLGELIKPGTVIVFDEFYGYRDWYRHEAKAFFEYLSKKSQSVEFLAWTSYQLAVRIVGSEGGKKISTVHSFDWIPRTPGIGISYHLSLRHRVIRRARWEIEKFLRKIKK
ncbi:MAG: phytanoyl-CoA dioxygenase family protein, partial [Candidatus Omnitrophica bacterium]|nr:phytanoyl-CoA dioxygenase family protein [Candidatus Omnitrophota bacterium]